MTFEESLNRVSSLEHRGWRLGLDRMEEFLRLAGLSDKLGSQGGPQYIHIAGTNGKGSVTAFVQSILREQGWRVGSTFSPFVYNVRERIQFGYEPSLVTDSDATLRLPKPSPDSLISETDFARMVAYLWPVAQTLEGTELGGPTEFEFKTAMGFAYWAEQLADYVALEVGLGGRLDATNVVVPAASVVVSIGLDHTQLLGDTLGKIAVEKAGIVKEGKPVVVGDLEDEARIAVETIAKINQAPAWIYGRDVVLARGLDGYRVETPGGSYERLSPGIQGVAQPHNMAVAIAACEAAGAIRVPSRVKHGVAKASAPGRMQWAAFHGRRVLLDGAHNGDAARILVQSIQSLPEEPSRIILLTGMLEGHVAADFYEPLATIADEVHFVPIDFRRTRQPEELQSEAGWLFLRSQTHQDIASALTACLDAEPGLILVTGSFYLVGEVGRLIGLG